mmetsp:Transcript_65917/g.133894  ORF Transcript_65917/g.133894 Transcript_65917/m.133894 type:complete len:287 (-) Transcript_65917:1297-2157(-)
MNNLESSLNLAELFNPAISHCLGLRSKLTRGELNLTTGREVDLKSPGDVTVLVGNQSEGGLMDIFMSVVNQLTVLFFAPVDEAAIFCNPHLPLKPILCFPSVTFCLHLPQLRAEDGGKLMLLVGANLHAAVLDAQPELFDVSCHVSAQSHCLNCTIHVGCVHQQPGPFCILVGRFSRETNVNILFMLVVSSTVQPESIVPCRADFRHLGSCKPRSIYQDQTFVLLDAEIAEGSIERHPHITLQPVRWLLCVAIVVQFPQGALELWGLAGSVFNPISGGSVNLLVHR